MKRIILASQSPRRREILNLLKADYAVFPSDVDEDTEEKNPALLVEELSLRKAKYVAELPDIKKKHGDAVVLGSDTVVVIEDEVCETYLRLTEEFIDMNSQGNDLSDINKREKINLDRDVSSDSVRAADFTILDLNNPQNLYEEMVKKTDRVCNSQRLIIGKPKDENDAFHMLKSLQGNTHKVYTGVALVFPDGSHEDITFHEITEVDFYPMTDKEILDYIASGEPMDKAGAYGVQGRACAFVSGIRGDYNTVVGLPVGKMYQVLKDIE